ncbi:glutamine amidotransferase of anthranilate synthase or para-aminobenzoate synthase [Roseobacter sp. CCS2]|nr:glutamine amidotransferase of anthranilate synthase or para-aminobenzoate synthase [Roseobacter sp. CCS2]
MYGGLIPLSWWDAVALFLPLAREITMLLLIDNYDSFTYNLVHYLGELGADVVVRRNDALNVQDAMAMRPDAIMLSPGPCDPSQAGICLALVQAAAETKLPLMGVCLGHQAIGEAFGGNVVRCHEIVHGKMGAMQHTGKGLFAGLPSPFDATRYHSLIVERETLPDCLEITGELEDGTIMGLQHRELPIHGVQFHPESIRSEHGHQLLQNFLKMTKVPA